MPSHFRLKFLAAAITMAAASSVCATPVSSDNNLINAGQSFVALTSHATVLHAGDTVVGPLAVAQPMNVSVSLKLRNKAQLDAFVANQHNTKLTTAQFNALYAPTQAQAEAVASYLTKSGFSNVTIAPNRQLVTATGRADTAAAAFHTNFVHVHTHDGRDAFATSSNVNIPAALQSSVLEVLGLQNVHIFHVPKPIKINATSGTATGHKPADFAAIYNATGTATGSTVNVGVITEGNMKNIPADFSSFLSANPSLGNIPLNVVKVDGAGTDVSGDAEWDLDTQNIAGMSGGLKALYLYDTSGFTEQGLVDAFNAAVTANVVQIVNVSIGGCETSFETNGVATGDDIFEQAIAQGQTFSVSSGDSGADECGDGGITPDWPADSQYVVSDGGTELYTTGTIWNSETVWNNTSEGEGSAGGSPSKFEAQPTWQKNIGQNSGSKYRGVPDIAFDASPDSGSEITVDGSPAQYGGTSLASPLFVGVWARTLATKSSLGFAAPLIYADAAANYATDFHDVTSGNNIPSGKTAGETAAVGWDYASGFGSINVANFIAHVAGGGSTPPPPPPPPAGPSANFTDSVNGLTASFTNSSTDTGGTINAYAWNFGDSSTSTAASPSHTYTAAGTYTVSLKVTDSNNNTSTKTGSVTVASTPPPAGGTFSNNTKTVIGDNRTINSSIKVSGEKGTAAVTFSVNVNITHNWSGDLEVDVVAPDGTYAELIAPNYNNNGNINKSFSITTAGGNLNGTWKLRVIDNDSRYTGDYGSLNNWSLTF